MPGWAGSVTRRQRLGWLLRANRVCGTQVEYHRLRDFALAYADLGPGAVSLSTLSRWENGRSEVTYDGARRYEALLGLAPLSLVAVCDTVSRYLTRPGCSAPVLARSGSTRRSVDALTARACGGDWMTGADWDELTNGLAREPHLTFSPADIWARLAGRLLTEMSISDGQSWLVRAEAFNRLIAHPVGQEAALSVTASAASDRSVQSLIGTVTVFDASAHSYASTHVVRHVTHPVTDRTFYGGLLASVKKLRFGQLDHDQMAQLVPALLDQVRAGRASNESRLAAMILTMLPVAAVRKWGTRLWQTTSELLADFNSSSPLVDQISAEAQADLAGRGVGAPDLVLPRLVHEIFFDPVFDKRLYTCFLIYATPYRVPVAQALAKELVRVYRTGPADRTVILLEALRVLGDGDQRRAVERLLLEPGLAPTVANAAVYALGHIGGRTPDRFWHLLIRNYLTRWSRTTSKVDLSILDRTVYALGMSDRLDLLRKLTAEPGAPDEVRRAAQWWTSLPQHVLTSVRT